jgi:hypothetical protein
MHANCLTTHPQLISGICPWCEYPVNTAHASRVTGESHYLQQKWDTVRMMQDLASGGDTTRKCTLENLVHDPPETANALLLLRRTITDPLRRIRDLSSQAVCRLAGKLDLDSVGPFEAQLSHDLSDEATLTLVLWVYFAHQNDASARERRHRLIIRIAEHMPDHTIPGYPLFQLRPSLDGESFVRAKTLWLSHVESSTDNARIIGNAALFFTASDRLLSNELLRKCKEIEPSNPRWPRYLGLLYSLEISTQPSFSRRRWSAELALVEFEQARTLSRDDDERWSLLSQVAQAAFDSGLQEKARHHAEELISGGQGQESAWARGSAIHKGNLLLGRLALLEEDVDEAKSRLIAAVTPPDSNSYMFFVPGSGPSMALAKEIMEIGERDAVIKFLRMCSGGWERDGGRLSRWMSEIERGILPDFGANLDY